MRVQPLFKIVELKKDTTETDFIPFDRSCNYIDIQRLGMLKIEVELLNAYTRTLTNVKGIIDKHRTKIQSKGFFFY